MMEENSKEGSGENPSLVSGVFLPENSRKRVFQSWQSSHARPWAL